ncbi:MAG TPA: DUF3108 domain-containing protein [Candidatus Binataceae bacterium]|nr:DUF3108 domain-containing protein [Candidatus Binataceae bacterium]
MSSDRPPRPAPLMICLWLSLVALSLILQSARVRASGPDPHPRSGPRPPRPPKPIALPANLNIPRYSQGPEPFHDGEILVYEASWEGIPAARARVTLRRTRSAHPRWNGEMWLNTSRVVDVLYRMRDYFHEDFDYATWCPDHINILQHENARLDRWLAVFDRPRQIVRATRTNRQGRTWVRLFTGGAPWGPFSGAMMALSQPLAPDSTYTFDVFAGGTRYVFAFTVEGRDRLTTPLGTFNALRIQPAIVWISENSYRNEATGMTLWVSDDPRHLPLRATAAVFFGTVEVDLTQVSDAPRSNTAGRAAIATTPLVQ